jgi:integrase
MMGKGTVLEAQQLEAQLESLLPRLSKAKVRHLKELILHHYIKAYNIKSNQIPRYGTLNKGFRQEELDKFLAAVDNPKFRLFFSYQAYLGLRIGEAVKIRLEDINQATRELKVFTEKARVLNTMIIPLPFFNETLEYVKANEAQIGSAQGYLFYANKEASHAKRTDPWLELNYVRKVFRSYIRLAGLDEVYGQSEERDGRGIRHLHRLTTHSLRHYAITKFSKATNGNLILTSRFARHLKPETTLNYVHSDKSELYSYAEQMAAQSR